MADFGAPSFSLGLDLDLESDNPPEEQEPASCEPPQQDSIDVSYQSFEEDEHIQEQTLDHDIQVEDSPPVLKRLRRGPSSQPSGFKKGEPMFISATVDDEIEDFSSQEDCPKDTHSSVQNHSAWSTTKFTLPSRRVLPKQWASKPKAQKGTPCSNASASTSLDTSEKQKMFTKLTSPLRRFQLLDSDSDDLFADDDLCKDARKVDSSGKKKQCSPSQFVAGNQQKKSNISSGRLDDLFAGDDLCKDARKVDSSGKKRQCSPSQFVAGNQQKKSNISSGRLDDLCKDAGKVDLSGKKRQCSPSQFVAGNQQKKSNISSGRLDDISAGDDLCKDARKLDSSCKMRQCSASQFVAGNQQKKSNISSGRLEDLWKDFTPKKNVKILTPALDEFCEEYFKSVKDDSANQSKGKDIHLSSSKTCFQENGISERIDKDGRPPAYRYFYHDDSRIKRLIRNRLPNFFPLGAKENHLDRQSDAASIDYMSQFGHRETPSQSCAKGNKNFEQNRKRGRKNSKKSNAKEAIQASANWVDPKTCTNIPKDAGKRRVHANNHSAGHWYTNSNGRKVYVTKNGDELTGRDAYRNHKKESGTGARKSRKKASPKKKKSRR